LSTTVVPAAAGVDVRGLYRVFARVSSSVAGTPFTFQLHHGAGGLAMNAITAVTLGFANVIGMIDLGLVQMPQGFDPVTDGLSNTVLPVAGIPLSLFVGRPSGTGQLTIDYLLFAPADDRLCIVRWGTSSPTTFVLDGTTRSVYGLDGSGNLADVVSAGFVGDPPMVAPNVTNRVVFASDVATNPTATDPVTGSAVLSCSYWPRYLSVRPVAS
jgi:hypothetical protein